MGNSEELYERIVGEIGRLSFCIYKGIPESEAKGLSMIINHLAAVLLCKLSLDDFHEHMSDAPTKVREYYYELLFEEK